MLKIGRVLGYRGFYNWGQARSPLGPEGPAKKNAGNISASRVFKYLSGLGKSPVTEYSIY